MSACKRCDGDGYVDLWLEDDEGREYPVSAPCPNGCPIAPSLLAASSPPTSPREGES